MCFYRSGRNEKAYEVNFSACLPSPSHSARSLPAQARRTRPRQARPPGAAPLCGRLPELRVRPPALRTAPEALRHPPARRKPRRAVAHCLNNTIRKLKGLPVMIFIVTANEVLKNLRKFITGGGWYLWLEKKPRKTTKNL